MSNETSFVDMIERTEHQRSARRNFIRMCGGAAVMTGGLSLLAACDEDNNYAPTPAPSPTPTPAPGTGTVADTDVLNFALQLEYLEANYYSYATTGQGIAASLQTGTGTQGSVITGSGTGAARQVTFTDQVLAQYAREIAADEIAHVTFLRNALGSVAVAQPSLNLSGSATVTTPGGTAVGAFTAAARAAGVIGASDTFDPFASDENFLIGSYLLTDVGVTAYRGSARLLTSKAFIEAAAGILTTECYHDGVIRSSLWQRGLAAPTIYTRIQQISDARDGLDGATDTDQGIGDASTANLVPTNSSGMVLGRTPQQVLNVVYQTRTAVNAGGFYPSGVNGNVKTSGAN